MMGKCIMEKHCLLGKPLEKGFWEWMRNLDDEAPYEEIEAIKKFFPNSPLAKIYQEMDPDLNLVLATMPIDKTGDIQPPTSFTLTGAGHELIGLNEGDSDTSSIKRGGAERKKERPVISNGEELEEMESSDMEDHNGIESPNAKEGRSFYSWTDEKNTDQKEKEKLDLLIDNQTQLIQLQKMSMEGYKLLLSRNRVGEKREQEYVLKMAELLVANSSNPKIYADRSHNFHKKFRIYPNLYVTKGNSEYTLKELFSHVLSTAGARKDYSYTYWNNIFQMQIYADGKENPNHGRMHLQYTEVLRMYKEKYQIKEEDLNVFHILFALYDQVAARDEANRLGLFSHFKIFERHEDEPWEYWYNRLELLLENTQYADLDYEDILNHSEIKKQNAFRRRIDQFQRNRKEMLGDLWQNQGQFENYVKKNLRSVESMKHPKSALFISTEYFTKFFQFSVREIEWDREDPDSQKAIRMHRERIMGKSGDCDSDTPRADIGDLDLGPKLTLRQSAKVMDGVYYLRTDRFMLTDAWAKLPRMLSLTEQDKKKIEKLEGNNGKKKNERTRGAEINHANVKVSQSKGNTKERKSPVEYMKSILPEEQFKFFSEEAPRGQDLKKEPCKYKDCTSKKRNHYTAVCFSFWKNNSAAAAKNMETIMELYKKDHDKKKLKKNLEKAPEVDYDDSEDDEAEIL